MKQRVKAWIVFPGGTKFGEGRAELLRRVEEEGSLKRAVERMGMSYRAAWGYLRELEGAAGFEFLERAGRGPGGGTRLTAKARRFLAAFDAYHAGLDASAARAFRAAFAARRRG
jgi:molybdate transport system regulatory protein